MTDIHSTARSTLIRSDHADQQSAGQGENMTRARLTVLSVLSVFAFVFGLVGARMLVRHVLPLPAAPVVARIVNAAAPPKDTRYRTADKEPLHVKNIEMYGVTFWWDDSKKCELIIHFKDKSTFDAGVVDASICEKAAK